MIISLEAEGSGCFLNASQLCLYRMVEEEKHSSRDNQISDNTQLFKMHSEDIHNRPQVIFHALFFSASLKLQ